MLSGWQVSDHGVSESLDTEWQVVWGNVILAAALTTPRHIYHLAGRRAGSADVTVLSCHPEWVKVLHRLVCGHTERLLTLTLGLNSFFNARKIWRTPQCPNTLLCARRTARLYHGGCSVSVTGVPAAPTPRHRVPRTWHPSREQRWHLQPVLRWFWSWRRACVAPPRDHAGRCQARSGQLFQGVY